MSLGSNAIFSHKTIIKFMMKLPMLKQMMAWLAWGLSSASTVIEEMVEEVVEDIVKMLPG